MTVADELRAAELPQAAIRALGGVEGVWIAGGAVRDAALGQEVTDLDLAVAGDPGQVAKALSRELGEPAFELSAEFGTWRVMVKSRGWQVDITALRGDSIEADLARRDFTIGAAAVPLAAGEVIDPYDGLVDLERGLLRAVGPSAFTDDPLRLLRAARLAANLDLTLDADTVALAHDAAFRAAEPAGERQFAELRQLLGGTDPLRGLRLLDELRLTAVVLPELEKTKGVGQGPNHHLDVHGHTLEVLAHTVEIERELPRFVTPERGQETADFLAEPLADEMDRAVALRFGALLHDIAKPATRAERDGFVGFKGHDVEGASTIAEIMGRLRASRRLTRHLQALTLHHLRLGFMVREAPLPLRRVHDYLRATEPVTIDVTLLTVADRLAARGGGPIAAPEMVRAHLALAQEMVAAGLDWHRDGPPRPLLRGDEIAAELGIDGPEIGEKLAELEAAQYAGEISDREGALGLLRG
jgi:putative nucleotidyltransferase with HDIG domain